MQFVQPTFLWALFLIAIPIIIHLFYFRRHKRILFSNTQFLQEVKEERSSRNRLRHLLVLLSRILAVIFIVLAFAQPFIPFQKKNTEGEKAISVYIDNSFSMQAEGNGQLLFDEAKSMAEEIIMAHPESSRFQILTNDFEGKHQRLVSKSEALTLLEDIAISPAFQSSKTVFERQQSLLKDVENKVVYQISDFQENAALLKNDTNYTINLLPVTPANVRNVYFDSVWFEAPIQLVNQSNKLVVKIANESAEEVSGTYNLQLNGQSKAISDYEISPNSYQIDTLNFMIIDTGWNQGQLILNDYPITFDDEYFFTFFVENQVNVLSIGSEEKQLFGAVFKGIENVNYTGAKTTTVDYSNINNQQLIILNQLPSIPSGLTESLEIFLQKGGNLFVVPSNDMDLNSYNQLLAKFEIGKFSGVNEGARTVSAMNLQHQVLFDLFDELPQNMKLPTVQRMFYLQSNTFSKEQAILSFTDNSKLLTSFNVKKGQFYLMTAPVDGRYTDFGTHPIFAPIVYKMAILGVRSSDIAFSIAANTAVKLQKTPANGEATIKMANDLIEVIPQKQLYDGEVLLNVKNASMLTAGFYNITADKTNFDALVALNYNRKESSLKSHSTASLQEQFPFQNVQILSNSIAQVADNVKLQEHGTSLWKWCVILALLFLAVEVLLLRFLPK